MEKQNKGVTLIALVITIIVLLILATITLNFVLGDNGIIEKARVAKEETEKSQEKESQEIEQLENKLDEYGSSTARLGTNSFEMKKFEDVVSTENSWLRINIQEGLSKYRYLYFTVHSDLEKVSNMEVYNTSILDTNDLKNNFNSSERTFALYYFPAGMEYRVYFYYGDENTIYAKVTNQYHTCTVYGIK